MTESSPPPGRRDYSTVRLSTHAVARFVERFEVSPEEAEGALRSALARARRLGRNSANAVIAVLALHQQRALVALIKGSACLTVLTWNQFLPHLAEFGRAKLPRKRGRLFRRLLDPE